MEQKVVRKLENDIEASTGWLMKSRLGRCWKRVKGQTNNDGSRAGS